MFYRHVWVRLQENVNLYETKFFIRVPGLSQPPVLNFGYFKLNFRNMLQNSVGLNEIQKTGGLKTFFDKWQL